MLRRGSRASRILREGYQRKERCTEGERGDLQKVPSSPQLGANKHSHVRKLRLEKEALERTRGSNIQSSCSAKNSSCFYQLELGTS